MANDGFAKAIEKSRSMEQYDGYAKNLLSYKEVIAVILKAVGHEFQGMTIEEIKGSIDSDPEIETGRIVGGGEEELFPWGAVVRYDIKFTVHIKQYGNLKLYVNLEAQKGNYPGYDLVTRGVCYGTTLLSGQLEKEVSLGDYDNLKKVYSIWICLNVPEKDANTVTEYRIVPKDVYGSPSKYGRYDLMSVLMVRLPNHEPTGEVEDQVEKMLAALYTIFKAQKTPKEKCKELKGRYGIPVSTEFEDEVNTMCNFSEAILEQGIERGIEQGIEQGREEEREKIIRKMVSLGYPVEEITQIYERELVEKVLAERKEKE